MTTRDAGENWKVNLEIPQEYFNACDIISPQHICIVGDKGLIIFVSLSEITLVDNTVVDPFLFGLKQNYPNPFNSSTTIKYHSNEPSNVVLKIYNLSGQEIERLVREFQTEGEHEITWQPKGLPSGVYFYRLQVGKFSETKKLILQK
jgi:hypothetical protein